MKNTINGFLQHHRVVSVTVRNMGIGHQSIGYCMFLPHFIISPKKVWFDFIPTDVQISLVTIYLSLTWDYLYRLYNEESDHNLPVYDNKAKWDSSPPQILYLASLLSASRMRGRKTGSDLTCLCFLPLLTEQNMVSAKRLHVVWPGSPFPNDWQQTISHEQ